MIAQVTGLGDDQQRDRGYKLLELNCWQMVELKAESKSCSRKGKNNGNGSKRKRILVERNSEAVMNRKVITTAMSQIFNMMGLKFTTPKAMNKNRAANNSA